MTQAEIAAILQRLQAGENVPGWGYMAPQWQQTEQGDYERPASFWYDYSPTQRQAYNADGSASGGVFEPGAGYRRMKENVEPLAKLAFGAALGYGLMNPGAAAGAGGGSGAFLGEGVASGVGAWDAAAGLGGAAGAGGAAAGAGGLGGIGAGGAGAGMGFFDGIGLRELLPLGADLLGGVMANRAAGQAVDAQSAAAREANALQKYMYDTTRQDYAPYREAGYAALNKLQNLLNNPGQVRNDPGYQFARNEGMRALRNSASAQGMTYSGPQTKAIQQYASDYADTRLNNLYNRYSNAAGLGQVGVNGTANAGQQYANNVGNNLMGMGNAQAANAMFRGSTYQNMLGQLGAFGANRMRSPAPSLNGQPWGGTADDPWYG